MSENRKYRPSNGTEGMGFEEMFCGRCVNCHPDPDQKPQCEIMMRAFLYEINHERYPDEWIWGDDNRPTCTAFVKWDWGRDDDGNWIEPVKPPPDDPNQLCFPFIFDELNIPHGVRNVDREAEAAQL